MEAGAAGIGSILRQEAQNRSQGSPISRRILTPAPKNFLKRVPKGQLGRVLHAFSPRHDDEVELKFNEQVLVLDARELGDEGPTATGDLPPGWLEVQLQARKGSGWVPAAYVEFTAPAYGAEAEVLFDLPAQEQTGQYLELVKGERLTVTSWNADGWHCAYNSRTFQYGVVPEGYVALANPADYSELEELLLEMDGKEYPYVGYLGDAVDVSSTDALCKDLLMLFNTKDLVIDLLRGSIEAEVKNTLSEGTLFRKNSLSTHLMSLYARLLGKRYLKDTLRPLIVHVLSCQGSFEIDPHRISDDEDINANVQTLRLSAQKFLHQVMESVNAVPLCLRLVCQALQQTVKPRFPSAARKAVGGFYFLRFICPAIVSPEGFGVIDKLEPRGRRALIMMSKIVQTLSNGVMFGAKEAFMTPMNDFIKENLENVHFVLDKLATVPPNYDPATLDRLPEQPEAELSAMRERLHVALAGVVRKMARAMRGDGEEVMARTVEELCARLGPPPTKIASSSSALTNSPADRRVSTKLVLSDFVKESGGAAGPAGGGPRGKKGAAAPRRPPKKMAKSTDADAAAASKGKKFKPKPLEENPLPMCMSFLFKKRPGKKLWNKRFFVCYMRGDAIHYYQGPEDMPQKIQGSIDLATEGTAAFILGDRSRKGNPSGWEFYIKGPTCGVIHLVASEEDTMRQWISCIDRRTRELRQPTGATHPLRALLSSLEAKQAGFEQQLQGHQNGLKSSDGAERAMHTQKIEELTLNIAEVKRSIAIAKAT
mmetsp:Transcript_13181/g.52599  ORF Transcript_13181/g.52599 Transcript_13181/m.52599 type:complete len:767 (-) Transcript_13181:76-2376(-)